jgi:hypothetical protein
MLPTSANKLKEEIGGVANRYYGNPATNANTRRTGRAERLTSQLLKAMPSVNSETHTSSSGPKSTRLKSWSAKTDEKLCGKPQNGSRFQTQPVAHGATTSGTLPNTGDWRPESYCSRPRQTRAVGKKSRSKKPAPNAPNFEGRMGHQTVELERVQALLEKGSPPRN